ncbi:hypothetical protein [Sphingomonas sp. A2-49]|uniref:hypothetical protein n=1 Tax=Sphingomonas sp. A2-49 TaxID=1391375 RepID=UPI00397737C3
MAYVGEGQMRWPATHVSDVVRLCVLALERGELGARYLASVACGHSVGESVVRHSLNSRTRDISFCRAERTAGIG